MLNTLSSLATFNQWYQSHATEIDVLMGLSTPPTADDNSSLAAAATDITKMSVCIQDEINSTANAPNNIFQGQQDVLDLNDSIAEAEVQASIARDRVSYIRHPEQHVSPYESWFPIDRPLQPLSLIILISLCIFIFCFLVLTLASLSGYSLIMYVTPTVPSRYTLSSQLTPSFWGLLILLISVVIYYRYRK